MRALSTLAALGIDPERLIRSVGFIGLLAVVFAESGIMLGFFLPGDSLLFISGFISFCSSDPNACTSLSGGPSGGLLPNIVLVSLGCWVAAVAGDQVGYAFGRRTGPRLFSKPDSKLFKQDYITRAEDFFGRHGSKTIMIARFVPVVRTFAPIVAGASAMNYRKFVAYNVAGGFIWAVGLTQAGYWLGKTFPWLGDRIEIIVVLIVVVSVLPVAIHLLRERSKSKKAKASV